MPDDDNTPNPGDGGEGGEELTLENPKVRELVEEAVAKATEGLKKNRDELLEEKKGLATKVKEFETQWSGLDPEHVKNLVERMKNDEETKLIAEGKIDEVITRRTEALANDYTSQIKSRDEKIGEFEAENNALKTQISDLVIGQNVSTAAAELGIVPTALEDVIFRAKGRFQLDENGKPIARDESGAMLMGKNGKDPLSVGEWLEGMREKAPHWFPAPSGGGAGGGNRGGSGGNAFTISRADARNPQKYQEAKAQAAKHGQQLQITE